MILVDVETIEWPQSNACLVLGPLAITTTDRQIESPINAALCRYNRSNAVHHKQEVRS